MRNYLIAGATAVLMAAPGNGALAQDQPPAAPAAAAAQPALPTFPQPDWMKVCAKTPDGRDICQTARDLLTPTANVVMTLQVNQPKDAKPTLTIILPSQVLLQNGARVLVDGQTLETAKFRICFGPTCAADMVLTDANMATLKKGKKLTVQAVPFQGEPVALDVGLDNFGKTVESAGIDTKAAQAKQQDYMQKLTAIFKPFMDAQQKAAQQQQGAPGSPDAPAPAQ